MTEYEQGVADARRIVFKKRLLYEFSDKEAVVLTSCLSYIERLADIERARCADVASTGADT